MSFVFVSPAGARQNWKIEPFEEPFISQHVEYVIDLFRKGWAEKEQP